MFLLQAFKPQNEFWKYIAGSLIIILIASIGQIPWVIALLIKSTTTNTPFPYEQDQMILYLDSNVTLFFMLLSFLFALLGIFIVVRGIHKQKIIEVTTSRKKIDWSRMCFSFGIFAAIIIVMIVLDYAFHPEHYIINFKLIPFVILAIIGVLLIPIQTSAEEYFFRGYLMQGIAVLTKNKWIPLVITSLIFGILHIANPEVEKTGYIILVYYIGTGLFLGIITLMDEGLELALGFHAANNLVTALLVTSDWTVFKTNSILKDISEPSVGIDIIFPVVVIFPIMILIFASTYKWTDWKERLTGKLRNSFSK